MSDTSEEEEYEAKYTPGSRKRRRVVSDDSDEDTDDEDDYRPRMRSSSMPRKRFRLEPDSEQSDGSEDEGLGVAVRNPTRARGDTSHVRRPWVQDNVKVVIPLRARPTINTRPPSESPRKKGKDIVEVVIDVPKRSVTNQGTSVTPRYKSHPKHTVEVVIPMRQPKFCNAPVPTPERRSGSHDPGDEDDDIVEISRMSLGKRF
ncbi:hypothetical protein DACRYDRAFT_116372 [Dacryopinax primogenitus]|uniref:Uncharacterized protein n=1 Tax=Dacryopinax primogenitus (strain DJM 731) TaxID=1858805 RepID=M5FVV0_DACPD|nr:uncharacterized protein DACRYDRAFT_116372 [Dacryopinax primogenitus]EJU01971.1 hypothetical protein DACRYDRAFT_116372 [Dacryopinax primogenitus]